MIKTRKSSIMGVLTVDVSALGRETSHKMRTLAVFLAVLCLATPLLGVFYYIIGAFPLSVACFAASGLSALAVLALRKIRRPEIFANFGIFLLWALLVMIRWRTGAMSAQGPELLAWVWNTVMIMLGVYLTGFLWGSIWASLVFVESGLAALFYKAGHQVQEVIPQSMAASYGLGAYLLALLTVLLVAFVFEKEKRELIERDQEQTELIQGSRRYVESLLTRTPVPMFVIDQDHRVVQWNRACEEMTGIGSKEILGKRVWKGFTTGEGTTFADELLEGLDNFRAKHGDKIVSQSESGSFVLEADLPHLKADGKVLVNAAPITDSRGKVRGAIQCIQEIPALNSNAPPPMGQLVAMDNSPCPTYMVDRKGKIALWNSACERHFGHSRDLMEGRSPSSLVAKQSRREFREAITAILKGKSAISREFKYYTVDGEPMYVRAEMFPRKDEKGKIEGCMVVNTDITDLKIRIAMLQRALTKNKEKLKSLADEYNLLKSNIASFIRRKESRGDSGTDAE